MDWDSYEWDPFERDFFKESVVNNSIKRLSDTIEESSVDEQDVRELNGVLNPKGETAKEKIDFLEIQADHWRQKALLETDERKEKWYKDAEKKPTRLVADRLRLENDLRPEEEETVSILREEIEESDIGRFEKFKKWAKENLLGLSAVVSSVAGILTTIIIGARKALKSGAKAIANIGKNFGAVISSLLNLIGNILAWGAKGITFLAKNLWILTLAITYFLYN